jgi:hypothetical protein
MDVEDDNDKLYNSEELINEINKLMGCEGVTNTK